MMMTQPQPSITSGALQADERDDSALRPQRLNEFIGQNELKENLSVYIAAAKQRNQSLDHVLFHGPPGLGKTTLAQIVAHELGVGFKATSGPILSKAGDLAALLTNIQPRDVLFIDEIHRLTPAVEEVLYPAMEDFQLDIMIGEGPSARSIRIDLPPFTLVGATTRTGLMTNPLRDRFGIPLRLDFYNPTDLSTIIKRGAQKLHITIQEDAAYEIAKRARGTPRIAIRLLKRVRDFAAVQQLKTIDLTVAQYGLERMAVDALGLDQHDRNYLLCIAEKYQGGPVGIETIAAALSEQRDTVEDVVEPYLMQSGFVQRTARGRQLTALAYAHIQRTMPSHLLPAAESV